MYLDELLIVNYRSCNLLHINLSKDDPNILIGINDCGKSTILKATENLLSIKPVFNFIKDDKKKNDLSNTKIDNSVLQSELSNLNLPSISYSGNECIILGKFFVEDEELIEETNTKLSPHLLWVLENSTDNSIWFGRVFNTVNQTIKEIILTPDHEENESILKLYQESDKKVRDKIKELKIPQSDIENDNNSGWFKKIELFRTIYKKYSLSNYWVDYESKNDKFLFPECRYLDWNVSMEQLTQVATDTINTKIQNQLLFAKKFAVRQASKAQSIVNKELDQFTSQFAIDLPNIKAFKANINLEVQSKLTDILINKANTDGDIHIEQQGEGVKRQIWFALIKWSALSSISTNSNNKKFIWCFDEPETHLYPKAQREFFDLIKDVSKSNIQSLISTHSTVFIDRAKFANICKVELNNGYSIYSRCLTVGDIYQSLQIRNSDFLFFDKFLVVEGVTEEYLIPELFKFLNDNRALESYGIKLICLGGKTNRKQNKQILENVLKDFNKKDDSVVYIFDNDVAFGSQSLTKKELEELNHFKVGKQDIEDSFHLEVWFELLKNEIPETTITIQEIEQLHASIPDCEEIPGNKKFYEALKRYVKSKLTDDQKHIVNDKLHGKGKDSADLIRKYVTKLEHINGEIIKAFDELIK